MFPSSALGRKGVRHLCALKEQRRLAGLTQQELADKIGTKKSYISKLENGHADIQLSTLFRIFAGLGKRVSLTIL
ncbi:MAG: helix-turn-helix transcriptional regulator [Prevotella sp.]|nr:helix-turn-helix transcriptional regulator [Prevotella sp.]